MNSLYKNFIYMSQIIGAATVDTSTGKKFGRVFDLSANMKDMYPKISALVIKKSGGGLITVPLKSIKKVDEDRSFTFDFLPNTPLRAPRFPTTKYF